MKTKVAVIKVLTMAAYKSFHTLHTFENIYKLNCDGLHYMDSISTITLFNIANP